MPALPVDLRSDTVTLPSPRMREAMARAEVGDDVLGEDPTVNRLQERVADVLGLEAGLFTPTGSMANQVAIAVHVRPGDEVVCEARSHSPNFEMGAMAVLSGASPRVVHAPRGLLTPDLIEGALFPADYHLPRASLLILENTHNMAGGTVHAVADFAACVDLARRRSLAVHLDGARLFNAAVATGEPVSAWARIADSATIALSKGLGAPAGSVLCGSRAFIAEARRARKRFGGGMRQVGILAAAGLVALEDGPAFLAEDHRRARRLAEGLAGIEGVSIAPAAVETNIVIFGLGGRKAAPLVEALVRRGVLCAAVSASEVRWVTHQGVDDAQVEAALAAAVAACKETAPS